MKTILSILLLATLTLSAQTPNPADVQYSFVSTNQFSTNQSQFMLAIYSRATNGMSNPPSRLVWIRQKTADGLAKLIRDQYDIELVNANRSIPHLGHADAVAEIDAGTRPYDAGLLDIDRIVERRLRNNPNTNEVQKLLRILIWSEQATDLQRSNVVEILRPEL